MEIWAVVLLGFLIIRFYFWLRRESTASELMYILSDGGKTPIAFTGFGSDKDGNTVTFEIDYKPKEAEG